MAALDALGKKGESEEVRIIWDATRGALANFPSRVKDHVGNPTSAGIRAGR